MIQMQFAEHTALFDDDCPEEVLQVSWHIRIEPDGRESGLYGWYQGVRIAAHRLIRALADGLDPFALSSKQTVDHINLNTFDNRLTNLRWADNREQQYNTPKRRGCASQYKGVTYRKDTGKWRARCHDSQGVLRHLGNFHSEIEAAKAYDAAALKWHGEFVRVNEYR